MTDRSGFDAALRGLRGLVREIGAKAQHASPQAPLLLTYEDGQGTDSKDRSPLVVAGLLAVAAAIAILLYLFVPVSGLQPPAPQPAAASTSPQLAPSPPVSAKPAPHRLDQPLKVQAYRAPGNGGSEATPNTLVVTQFYRALQSGDGQTASALVVPEVAEHGALSSASLTAKFSNLMEPLHLDNVAVGAGDTVRVRYSYQPLSGLKCVGLSKVLLDEAEAEPRIQRVIAKELCR